MRAAVLALALVVVGCAGARPVGPTADPMATIEPARLYQIGLAHERAGDSVRAEQYLAAALARGYQDAMIPLLRVCATGDRYGAALVHAQARLDANPDDWQLRYLTAELLGAVGRTDEERAELETLVSQVSDRPEPHFALAEAYAREGLDRKAAFHYRRYLALAPHGKYAGSARRERARLRRERHRRRR